MWKSIFFNSLCRSSSVTPTSSAWTLWWGVRPSNVDFSRWKPLLFTSVIAQPEERTAGEGRGSCVEVWRGGKNGEVLIFLFIPECINTWGWWDQYFLRFSWTIVSTRVLCAYFILALADAHGGGFRRGHDCGPSPIRCPGRATLVSAVKLEGSGCRYH